MSSNSFSQLIISNQLAFVDLAEKEKKRQEQQ